MTIEKDIYEVIFDVATRIENKVLVKKEIIAEALAANEKRIADKLKSEQEAVARKASALAKLEALGLNESDLKALGL